MGLTTSKKKINKEQLEYDIDLTIIKAAEKLGIFYPLLADMILSAAEDAKDKILFEAKK